MNDRKRDQNGYGRIGRKLSSDPSLADKVKRILKNYQRNDEELYKKFDLECRMLALDEIFLPRNKTTYEWILRALQEKNIKCKGWMDDWNGKFEIRFQG